MYLVENVGEKEPLGRKKYLQSFMASFFMFYNEKTPVSKRRNGQNDEVYVWRDGAVWMCWILTDADHKKNHRQLGFKWN